MQLSTAPADARAWHSAHRDAAMRSVCERERHLDSLQQRLYDALSCFVIRAMGFDTANVAHQGGPSTPATDAPAREYAASRPQRAHTTRTTDLTDVQAARCDALQHLVCTIVALQRLSSLITALHPSEFYTSERDRGLNPDLLLCTAASRAESLSSSKAWPAVEYWPRYVYATLQHAASACRSEASIGPAGAMFLAALSLHRKALAPMAHRIMQAMGPLSVPVHGMLAVVVQEHLAMLSGEALNGTIANLNPVDTLLGSGGTETSNGHAAAPHAGSHSQLHSAPAAPQSSSDADVVDCSLTHAHDMHASSPYAASSASSSFAADSDISSASSITYGATPHPRLATDADVHRIAVETCVVAQATWKHLRWFAGNTRQLVPQSAQRLENTLRSIETAYGADIADLLSLAVASAGAVAEEHSHRPRAGVTEVKHPSYSGVAGALVASDVYTDVQSRPDAAAFVALYTPSTLSSLATCLDTLAETRGRVEAAIGDGQLPCV
jgi:hypothetical protein